MDSRHINSSNSPSHSINKIDEELMLLNVNDQQLQSAATTSNINLYSNMNSRANAPSGNGTRRLNPGAQVFVPRSMIQSPNSRSLPNQTARNHSSTSKNCSNNHSVSNGNNSIQSSSLLDGENDIEDYVALSYLKEFINSISNKPNGFEVGVSEITFIVNSYLDEDECVLELIVNQIVDQSIIDGDFRYNGVRLCFHFMENIRPTITGQTFKNILFKRCQRECSRKVSQTTSANTFNHLRGLALFVADLYSRSKEVQLAENLPNLLMNILSSSSKIEDNVKCVCQVLKLCGQQLDEFFQETSKDEMKKVYTQLATMADCDISVYIRDMAKNIIKLAESEWKETPQAPSNIVNPYRNANIETVGNVSVYPDAYTNPNYQIQDMYDFGGDEVDEEVCNDFENFLRNLPPDSS